MSNVLLTQHCALLVNDLLHVPSYRNDEIEVGTNDIIQKDHGTETHYLSS
jgi:hypothetical protein